MYVSKIKFSQKLYEYFAPMKGKMLMGK